jgi:hypothetical protein
VTAEGAVLAAVACVLALGGAAAALLWAQAALGERLEQSGAIPGDPLALAWMPLAAAALLVAALVLVPTWLALAGSLWKEPVRLLEEKSL